MNDTDSLLNTASKCIAIWVSSITLSVKLQTGYQDHKEKNLHNLTE